MKLFNQLSAVMANYKRTKIDKYEFQRLLDLEQDYRKFYKYIADKHLIFEEDYNEIMSDSFEHPNFFEGGKICPLKNILRKHLDTANKNKAAIVWKGADHSERVFTYQSLFSEVIKFSSALRKLGLQKDDVVLIYLPNMPEMIISMLACTKLNAPHVVYHNSYSSDSLSERIDDCKPKMIITADESLTGADKELKHKVDRALDKSSHKPNFCIVVERTGKRIHMKPLRDLWYHDLISDEHHSDASKLPYNPVSPEHTLFMLYTSTNVTEPKALKFPVAGYLLWASYSFQMIFDCKPTDTFWCTADISWITGHSYLVYGPLMSGSTVLIFEDTIDANNAVRFYDICDKFNVNKVYTTPTILKSLMTAAQKKKVYRVLNGLELIATGGEKMDTDVLDWTFRKLGHEKAVMFDIYSITEAGGAIYSSIPGHSKASPGTVSQKIPGVPSAIVDMKSGEEITEEGRSGAVVFKTPFPSLCRNIQGSSELFKSLYIKEYGKKLFFRTGDGAEYDEDKNLLLRGRLDDVMHIGGKRIGLIEIEEAIKKNDNVKECAVVSINDEKRGDSLIAFVVLIKQLEESYHDHTVREIRECIINDIGEVALPSEIRFTRTLPKSPDGIILRELLKEIAMQM